MNEIVGWASLALMLQILVAAGSVLVAGILRGWTTGKYPSLRQWVDALQKLFPLRFSGMSREREKRSARRATSPAIADGAGLVGRPEDTSGARPPPLQPYPE